MALFGKRKEELLPSEAAMPQEEQPAPMPDTEAQDGGMEQMIAAQAALQPIGEQQIRKAMETLRKYKSGKANLEARVIDDEQWWKLRHWSSIPHGGKNDPKPTSA